MSDKLTVDVAQLWPALEAAADQAGFGIYVARVDGAPRILHATERAARMIGRSVDEVVGMTPWGMLTADDQQRIRELISNRDGSRPITVHVEVPRPDGISVSLELGVARIQTRDGMLSVGYMRDVTADLRVGAALEQSEEKFRFLVESAPDGIVILRRGRIALINPRAAALLGVDPPASAIGRQIGEFLPAEDARRAGERIGALLQTGRELPPSGYRVLANPARTVEIKSIRCRWEGEGAVLAFARDVTERNALEAKLIETDRLAALGTLAAGVAHEINNPLTYAQLALQRIERALAEGDDRRKVEALLRDVQDGLERIGAIAQGLRTFARADDSPPGPLELEAVVEQAVKLVDNELRHRSRLVRAFSPAPPILGIASRLEQVVINVLLNAAHSLAASPDPQITIAIAPRTDGVALVVRDNGCGIAADDLTHVFDPFFTTKRIGEGMGLGLSVCKSIVESFGGRIAIESEQNIGTTVTIEFQRASSTLSPAVPAARAIVPAPRRLRILIVDDEPLLRASIAQMLELEHDVTVAEDGASAIGAALASRCDAIVCDVMMPGVDGRAVYERLAVARPGLERRIVFITGGAFSRELSEFLGATGNPCVTKPFRIERLLEAIAAIAR